MTPSERNDHMRNLLRSEYGAEKPRYCTQCRCQRPRAGGREIAFNGGKNSRWVCGMHGSDE